MYITRSLRDKLEEWKNRLANSPHRQLNKQLDSFLSKVENEIIIKNILLEIQAKADYLGINPRQECRDGISASTTFPIFGNQRFRDDSEQAIYYYCLLKELQTSDNPIFTHPSVIDGSTKPEERTKLFVGHFVEPLVYYIQDQLDEGSAILYLLEKYKQKSEWFFQEELRKLYENAPDRKQEEVLDKDLRKFLFDQGIDYPFSQTSSPSGEADVVSLLYTNDPLVLEVKIFDRSKTYGKNRVIDGFRQIVSYANDYNKPIGYLLIFNMDTVEVNIVTKNNNNKLPVRISFAGKTYFVIFVNIPPLDTTSASKRGKLEKITISEEELTAEVQI